MASNMQNGTADAAAEASNIPALVGINFGNSFASIAVFIRDGLAECIANEDGERQIACALSFFGEEMVRSTSSFLLLYKLLKANDLFGRFLEIPQSQSTTSARVIQHPEPSDEPAYKVEILQPAPAPLPKSTSGTPAASSAPTPRSETC
ncbi:hypothetical protein BT96DRAFT_1000549 [Gymnopus androsaceus JB14]|uniref:Uncharacterized protein n=1 Tax=Gymnopus androsaceus JB14 TaxID=1447944 RepID=A0A6A4H3F4_9AGAR|nr:hypothetical protein BT96DRAFT_1000549 [Gymnopus androsaceus JB14]